MHRQPEKEKAPTAATVEALDEANPYHKESNMADSIAVQTSSQPVFSFGDHQVRVVVRDGEPWFVASDVCAALDYKNTSKAVADHLDEDERSNEQLDRSRMGSKSVIINESGLYALVLRSRKPEARKFAKWVTSEVLPAIRKTGVYVGKPFAVNPGDVLNQNEQNTLRLMLKSAVERLPKEKQAGAMVKGWSKLKAHFGVSYREIPRQEFSEAVSIIARHTAEWELVDPAPAADTVNEQVAEWVKKIEAENDYPAMLFMPLVSAVQRKLGKRMIEMPPGQMLVDRQRLAALWVDLGKIRSRIDAMGCVESDFPPSWWAGKAIS